MGFVSILSFARQLIQTAVTPGETVIDATVGNGIDTQFLAEQVGTDGKVYGFDIQEEALRQADTRLQKVKSTGCTIRLLLHSHARMQDHIPTDEHGQISAIMFNLGYLPGHDHSIITQPESTLPALEASARLLKQGGIITVILYTGHTGGQDEANEVVAWAEQLPQHSFQVLTYRFINQRNHPPYLLAIHKR